MMKLRVLATASAMVPDYRSLGAGRKDFIGWKWDPTLGDGVTSKGGFVRQTEPTDVEPISVDHLNNYKQALRDGDLLPADDATAEACGLPKPTKAVPVYVAPVLKENDHD